MKRTNAMKEACAVMMALALPALQPIWAEDDAAAEKTEEKAEKANDEAAEAVKPVQELKPFYSLMRCREIRAGEVQVRVPDGAWAPAVEGHFYPLGTEVQAAADAAGAVDAVFAFGDEAKLTLTNAATFATVRPADPFDAPARTVRLVAGRIELSLPRGLKDGLFSVEAPFFVCTGLAGESRFDYAKLPDGDEAVVRCITGTFAAKGRHYSIARMSAADQIRIRSSADDLFTSLRGESGDVSVKLDQGVVIQKDFETGEESNVPRTIDFVLSPKCAVKIFRAVSAVGGRVAVSTMTFDAQGVMKNRVAFAEKRPEINSGELVIVPKDTAKLEAAAKDKAAEAVETEEAEGDDAKKKKDDASAEEKSEEKDDEKKEEKSEE